MSFPSPPTYANLTPSATLVDRCRTWFESYFSISPESTSPYDLDYIRHHQTQSTSTSTSHSHSPVRLAATIHLEAKHQEAKVPMVIIRSPKATRTPCSTSSSSLTAHQTTLPKFPILKSYSSYLPNKYQQPPVTAICSRIRSCIRSAFRPHSSHNNRKPPRFPSPSIRKRRLLPHFLRRYSKNTEHRRDHSSSTQKYSESPSLLHSYEKPTPRVPFNHSVWTTNTSNMISHAKEDSVMKTPFVTSHSSVSSVVNQTNGSLQDSHQALCNNQKPLTIPLLKSLAKCSSQTSHVDPVEEKHRYDDADHEQEKWLEKSLSYSPYSKARFRAVGGSIAPR